MVAAVLAGAGLAGVGLPGAGLPSRLALATEYEVSHLTVQPAIDTLKGEGLPYSRRGLGVFVTGKR